MLLAASALLASLLSSPSPAEAAPEPVHFRLVPLGSGAWAAIAKPGDRASVGNAGFVVGSASVLVVDTFATEDAARELLAAIRRTTPLPVRWVVNTHYHLDHIGGNAVFRGEGAAIVAHENVRRWAKTENLKWRREITPRDRAVLEALALPDVTHAGRATLWLGDRSAEVLFRPGHTGGDSIVRVAQGDLVFGGDLVWNATVPNLIDASTEAWLQTLDGFIRDFPAATFVPGHGEPARALSVRYFRDYLSALREAVGSGIARGLSGPPLVDAALASLRPRYAAWTWFDDFAASNASQTEQEMRGTKRFAP